MPAPFSPILIADYFVDKAKNSKYMITPMKLVKLVYISHGWYMAVKDIPLISENVEAWQYGPVIRSVYGEFKRFGNKMIDSPSAQKNDLTLIDDETKKLLDKIWDVYGYINGVQLSALTHQEGTPWFKVWNNRNNKISSAIIPNSLIKDYYISKANKQVKYN